MYLKRVYLKIKSKVKKKKYSQFYWAYWLNNNISLTVKAMNHACYH